LSKNVTVVRINKNIEQTEGKIEELLERYKDVNLSDRSQWANTSFAFSRQLYNMLELSKVVALGARLRDESRGAHYKPDFPERDDERFLKTTKASFVNGQPKIEYEDVDTSLIKPRPRKY
jgi:succinate dehydrogenase / fumarate reductase flavoprotein subunit